MPHSSQRRNYAFKIAYLADIQRIQYAVTLSAFVHSWALLVISKLIPAAYTVLMFLAALHRAGRYGYIGTAIAYDLLSPQVVKATARKCSTRTLKRGLAFLKAIGLVELRPWTMPDQRIRVGDRLITVKGTKRVDLGCDRWATRQLRIVVLTDRAVALWDKATRSQSDRYLAHFRTCAILAPNSQVDQVGKPTMIDPQSSKHVSPSYPRNSVFDCVRTDKTKSARSASNDEKGWSTRPEGGEPPRTIEHRASTPKEQGRPIEPQPDPRGAFESAPTFGPDCSKPQATGCTRTRPEIPRGAPNSYTLACLRILSELHRALGRFSARQADRIYDRAKYELSRQYPAGWPTSCDWAYWTGRWSDFQPSQRRYHMMRDILPLLKSPAAITPGEPSRYREWTTGDETGHATNRPQNLKTELRGYLAKLHGRFCGDDD